MPRSVNNPKIFLMLFEKACTREEDCYAWTFNSELGNCLLSLTADVVQVIRSEHFESGLRPLFHQGNSWNCNFDREDEELEGRENEDSNDADAENVEYIKGEVQEEGKGEENIENHDEVGGSVGEGSEESQEEEEEWFNGSEVGGHESSRSNASDSSDDSVDYYDSTGPEAFGSKLTSQIFPTVSSSETESTSKSVTNDDLPNSAGTTTSGPVEMSSSFTSTTSEMNSTRTTTTTMTTSKTITATTTTNTATKMSRGTEIMTTNKTTTKSVTATTMTTKMIVTDTSTTTTTTGVTATTVTSKATNSSSKGTGNKSGDLIHCDIKIKALFNHISMLCYILHQGPSIIPDRLHPIPLCINPT